MMCRIRYSIKYTNDFSNTFKIVETDCIQLCFLFTTLYQTIVLFCFKANKYLCINLLSFDISFKSHVYTVNSTRVFPSIFIFLSRLIYVADH